MTASRASTCVDSTTLEAGSFNNNSVRLKIDRHPQMDLLFMCVSPVSDLVIHVQRRYAAAVAIVDDNGNDSLTNCDEVVGGVIMSYSMRLYAHTHSRVCKVKIRTVLYSYVQKQLTHIQSQSLSKTNVYI